MNRIDELRRKISVDGDSESLLLRYEALVLCEYAQFFNENLVPLKIVYEGPYCTGKSTTLAYLEALSNPINELKSIAIEGDRQLFLTIPWDL